MDTQYYMTKLGRNLRFLRSERKAKPAEIARMAGITLKRYQEIEAGRVNIRFATLVSLSQALGCKISDLVKNS